MHSRKIDRDLDAKNRNLRLASSSASLAISKNNCESFTHDETEQIGKQKPLNFIKNNSFACV